MRSPTRVRVHWSFKISVPVTRVAIMNTAQNKVQRECQNESVTGNQTLRPGPGVHCSSRRHSIQVLKSRSASSVEEPTRENWEPVEDCVPVTISGMLSLLDQRV